MKNSVLVACMDEDLDYGEGVYVAGVGGSAITRLGEGKQDLFPDEKRQLTKRIRPGLYRSLRKLAEFDLDMNFGVSSHSGCGWAGAQAIEGGNIPYTTRQLCKEFGLSYWGHIPHDSEPVIFGDEDKVKAHIGRHEAEHHHGARAVLVTVGGFISEEEIGQEAKKYGDAFIISADWLCDALENEFMSEKDAMGFLELQIDIADGIADGVTKNTSVKIFDAGRLSDKVSKRNKTLVEKLLKTFK